MVKNLLLQWLVWNILFDAHLLPWWNVAGVHEERRTKETPSPEGGMGQETLIRCNCVWQCKGTKLRNPVWTMWGIDLLPRVRDGTPRWLRFRSLHEWLVSHEDDLNRLWNGRKTPYEQLIHALKSTCFGCNEAWNVQPVLHIEKRRRVMSMSSEKSFRGWSHLVDRFTGIEKQRVGLDLLSLQAFLLQLSLPPPTTKPQQTWVHIPQKSR